MLFFKIRERAHYESWWVLSCLDVSCVVSCHKHVIKNYLKVFYFERKLCITFLPLMTNLSLVLPVLSIFLKQQHYFNLVISIHHVGFFLYFVKMENAYSWTKFYSNKDHLCWIFVYKSTKSDNYYCDSYPFMFMYM